VSCVKKKRKLHAVQKMKEDPSEPPCRGRLQTAISCFGQKPRWWTLWLKGVTLDHVMWGLERRMQVNLWESIENL